MTGQLDADRVRALFAELSDRLAAAGVSTQLFVVGGAAIALAYDTGRVTRDVDALFMPAPEVRQIAEDMNSGHGLEPDWLDDAAILFNTLGYATAQECIDLLTDTYPLGQLLPRHRYLAEEVATRARALQPRNPQGQAPNAADKRRRRERRATRSTGALSDPFGIGRDHGPHQPEPPARGL